MPAEPAPSGEEGFHGFVCDDAGRPVAKARVAVNYHSLETDPQGQFFLPHEKLKYERTAFVTVQTTFANNERTPPYKWDVSFARVFDYAAGDERVTIRPRVPSAIVGRILSAEGQPVPGATIRANIDVGLLVCSGHQEVGEPVQSDDQGRFHLLKLYPDNEYLLRVEAPGYERKWSDWIHTRHGENRIEVRVGEARSFVAGMVVDARNKPFPKARVLLGHLCCADAHTTTDAGGHFCIDSLLPDQEVELWAEGTTVKTKTGVDNLRIVARLKP